MTKLTPITNTASEVNQQAVIDLRHCKPAEQVLPPELLKEVGLNNNKFEQKNRMIYLSQQLSGRHLLENEAMDITTGDGLE